MPNRIIHECYVVTYDSSYQDVYWKRISETLFAEYGNIRIDHPQDVETLLVKFFNGLIREFESLIELENTWDFFRYTFWLHEEAVKLYWKILNGFELYAITEPDFALYKKVLKLILEKGCDIDLSWGTSDKQRNNVINKKISELIYIGYWIYDIADKIAIQKMLGDCYEIFFDVDGILVINMKHHYGYVFELLPKLLDSSYVNAIFDEQAIGDFKNKVKECFSVEYDYALGIIAEIKRSHSKHDYNIQTIQPYVLPINLSRQFGIPEAEAEKFYNGLTLSRNNKRSTSDVVISPYNMQRYLFKPILIYTINGEERALIGDNKLIESILVLSTNALHWNALPAEWLTNKCMESFMNLKGDEHDKLLEDKYEEVFISSKIMYERNLKTLVTESGSNVRIDNAIAGEIDFIYIDDIQKRIYVCEMKYNRARYEPVGFRNDWTNFEKNYVPRLLKKVSWVRKNVDVVNYHFKFKYKVETLDILDYEVMPLFLINTPTFYMLKGDILTLTLNDFKDYVNQIFPYPDICVKINDIQSINIQFPYFNV